MNRRPIERFRHHPLQSPDRQIRLLSILPSPEGSLLCFSLQTYILRDSKCPYFYALSYEWGSSRKTSEIEINGSLLKVRPNLRDFLDRLRSCDDSFIRPIWIDAICIDQNNAAEKTAQVMIMGQIFQSAKLVLTWLGKRDFENGGLIQAASTLKAWEDKDEYRKLVQASRFDFVSQTNRSQTPSLLTTAAEYIDMWNCIRLLCDQSFWRRRWIVQEQIKAQNLLLLWGYEEIPWTTLAIAFRTIHCYTTRDQGALERLSPWKPVLSSIPYKVWLHLEGDVREHSLLELMETYGASKCSEPRDKAYALIGISSDIELLQVNYDISAADLYVSLMSLAPDDGNYLKYSQMVLKALKVMNPPVLATDSALRDRRRLCDAFFVGQVVIAKRIQAGQIIVMIEEEILEMLIHSGTIVLPEELERIAEWAKLAYGAFRKACNADTAVTYFLVSDGQVGVSPTLITADDCIYSLPGPLGGPEKVYLRAESSSPSTGDDESSYAEATSPSLASPTSTTVSDLSISPVARVWLMDSLPPKSPSQETAISIPHADMVALYPALDIEFDERPSSPTLAHTKTSTVPSFSSHRGAHSDSVGSAIEETMRSPRMGHAERASTWPIDKIAREMRDRLILDSTSPLNSPD